MIIHAGDVSGRGTRAEIESFLNWFEKTDFKHKVLIAGNHDYLFESISKQELKDLMPPSIHYLNDSGVEIEGISIWGSPIQPWFYDWAFNRQRGEDIAKHWKLIPESTDILITHGPPHGILDRTVGNELVGCQDLRQRIDELDLKIHVFGHIHEGYGMIQREGVSYVNASVLNVNYRLVNAPVVLEY